MPKPSRVFLSFSTGSARLNNLRFVLVSTKNKTKVLCEPALVAGRRDEEKIDIYWRYRKGPLFVVSTHADTVFQASISKKRVQIDVDNTHILNVTTGRSVPVTACGALEAPLVACILG